MPTTATLAFERAVHSATTFGFISLSFVSSYSLTLDMQPGGGGFLRLVQGQLEPIQYTGTVQGFVSAQGGDRTSFFSALLEVATVHHFGTHHTELFFQLGR